MNDLHVAVADYLRLRRALGFKLDRAGRLLPDLAGCLQDAGAERLTCELALAWATKPAGAHPAWWRERLGIARGFARYLHTIDPHSEVPPADLLRARRPRVAPYLYSQAEIAALLEAAGRLAPPLRAATFQTLIGLIAVSGLRLGEALGIDRGDVDLGDGVLAVRVTKHDRPREVALHDTATAALAGYAHERDRAWPRPATQAFFVSQRGLRLSSGTFHDTFRRLIDGAGLNGLGQRGRPRPHDLRHTFALNTMLGWYRAGIDVDARLPLLSTYMGHVDPASTYWYMQAAPELLALAAGRLGRLQGGPA